MVLRSTEQPIGPKIYVASSLATEKFKNNANYVCNGTNDHVEIQAAIDEAYAIIDSTLDNDGIREDN